MKKIFAILSVVVLIFSMGVIGFATEKESKENYTTMVTLTESVLTKPDEDTKAQYKILTFDVEVTNNTENRMVMKDVDISIKAIAVDSIKEKETKVEWKKNDGEKSISSTETENASLICTVYTTNDVILEISVDDADSKTIREKGESAEFITILPEPTTTTTTTTTITTTEATKPTETETSTKPTETETSTTLTTATAPTESAKNNTIDSPDSPNAVAPIEDEAPNTGSNGVALTVFGALGITAIAAAMVTKKKKH